MKRTLNKTYQTKPVTDHAKQRLSERTDLSLKNFKNRASYIFKYGYKLHRFTGELYEYLSTKQLDGIGYSLRVYENYIFIFDTYLKRLLTVYPIPEEYLPISDYVNKVSSPSIIWIKTPDNKNLYVSEGDMLTEDIGEAIEFRTKQKAINYIRNNHTVDLMKQQGCEVIVI